MNPAACDPGSAGWTGGVGRNEQGACNGEGLSGRQGKEAERVRV